MNMKYEKSIEALTQNENGTIDVLVGYKFNLSEWALHLTSK